MNTMESSEHTLAEVLKLLDARLAVLIDSFESIFKSIEVDLRSKTDSKESSRFGGTQRNTTEHERSRDDLGRSKQRNFIQVTNASE